MEKDDKEFGWLDHTVGARGQHVYGVKRDLYQQQSGEADAATTAMQYFCGVSLVALVASYMLHLNGFL